jgi:protein-tyrosine phosphatase
LFRSGSLGQITQADIAELDRIGIRTGVDLRCLDERKLVPTGRGTPRIRAFDYPTEAVFRKARGSEAWTMYENYLELLRPHFRATVQAMIDDATPLVVHCSAGQDRTGVIGGIAVGTQCIERADRRGLHAHD